MPLVCDHSVVISELSVWMPSSSHLDSGTSYQGSWVTSILDVGLPLAAPIANVPIASLSSNAPCQVPHRHPSWPTRTLKVLTSLPLLSLLWTPSSSHLSVAIPSQAATAAP